MNPSTTHPRDLPDRRTVLRTAGAAALGSLAASALPVRAWGNQQDTVLVRDRQPLATVIHSDDADEQTLAAINVLITYIQKATGAELPVVSASQETSTLEGKVYVGIRHSAIADRIPSLGEHGYAIHADSGVVAICGPSPLGTQYGVHEFLERFVDVRWLQPGEAGEDVPQFSTLAIPSTTFDEEPWFLNRNASPMRNIYQQGWKSTKPDEIWGAHNRIHQTVRNMETLGYIFDPAIYASSRPDFYPILDGERHIPKPPVAVGWQPRLSAEGSVDAAIDFWAKYWEARPYYRNYGLSINDGGQWSEDEIDYSQRNSIGTVDASAHYYAWVNRVAAEMERHSPGQMCGVNAYLSVADAPPFALHRNVVVFLTRDRYGWVDPDARAEDLRWYDSWRQVSDNVGWYDYCFGSAYAVPRVYTALQASQYRLMADKGMRFVTSEFSPGWGEGPKQWIFSKLLWDPRRDHRKLVREWTTRAVGAAAAPSLAKYYDFWETWWTTVVPQTRWFSLAPQPGFYSPFFQFTDCSYLEAIQPADLERPRQLISQVVSLAATPAQRARAESLQLAFAIAEATVGCYQREVQQPQSDSAALKLIARTRRDIATGVAMAERRTQLLSQAKSDPILRHDKVNTLKFSGWPHEAAYQLGSYARTGGGRVLDQLRRHGAAQGDPEMARWARIALSVAEDDVDDLGQNMSFELGLEPWVIAERTERTRDPIRVDTGPAPTSTPSLVVPGGARAVRITQNVAAHPGFARFSIRSFTRSDSARPAGFIALEIRALGATGATIANFRSPVTPLSEAVGEWQEHAVADELPAGTASLQGKIHVQGVAWEDDVFVDSCRIIQTDEE